MPITRLEEAIMKRDEFLEKYPELKKFQNELDEEFDTNGNDPMTNLNIIAARLKQNLVLIRNGLTKIEKSGIMDLSKETTLH